MPRYVDVDKYLSDDFCGSHDNCTKWEDCFLCWAENATEDVAPVIHAEWKKTSIWKKRLDGLMICVHSVSCSNCNTLFDNESNYCPHCGAKMERIVSN